MEKEEKAEAALLEEERCCSSETETETCEGIKTLTFRKKSFLLNHFQTSFFPYLSPHILVFLFLIIFRISCFILLIILIIN